VILCCPGLSRSVPTSANRLPRAPAFVHAGEVADSVADTSIASPGLSVEVLVAGALFAASAGVTGLASLERQDPPAALLLLGWPFLAAAGGALVDQQPGSRVGRTLMVLSLGAVVAVVWASARFGVPAESPDLASGTAELSALLGCAVAILVPWAFRRPHAVRSALGAAALSAAGGLVVLGAEAGTFDAALVVPGWVFAVLGTLATWSLVLGAAQADGRDERRRVTWVVVLLAVAAVSLATTWQLWPGHGGYYATSAFLGLGALVVAGLSSRSGFRPMDEHLLDLGLILGVVVTAVVTAVLVRLGSELTNRPATDTTTAFTGLLTAAMAAPAALWIRRAVLARRYGSGLISPDDVAVITADLHAKTEPRDLLDKAARMVAAASGSAEARIVLGDDDQVAPEHWVIHPLVVGGDRVGALVVESGHPEGPEARQQRIVAQLLPTVALVARAVGLAVEAEHARRDVSRERDAERKRVLGDLHDGLGPVLAGMSMRVQAALRSGGYVAADALLTDLAADLAESRTDLRRIVAGITPSVLDDGDLESALRGLVQSFGEPTDGPRVTLEATVDAALSPAVKVAIYRSVAEGVTNALRHAAASSIGVRVRAAAGLINVDVVDDGRGGPVVPGVGLSSLAQRATSLGGCLEVDSAMPNGTHLHLELPTTAVEVRP
jgi:signal transduction histidine kinase